MDDKAVLSFTLRLTNPENLHIDVFVNDKNVWSWAAAGDMLLSGTRHMVIRPGGVLALVRERQAAATNPRDTGDRQILW